MNKILIDIDGVIRNMHPAISKKLNKKNYSYSEGSVILDMVDKDLDVLREMKTTKYYQTIKDCIKNPVFISYQRESWRPITIKWLEKHFDNFKFIFVNSAEEKLSYFKKAKYIIEDYPFYDDYSKIILISHYYNKNVKNPFKRINTKKELEIVMEKHLCPAN